jgi:hypothetical protein
MWSNNFSFLDLVLDPIQKNMTYTVVLLKIVAFFNYYFLYFFQHSRATKTGYRTEGELGPSEKNGRSQVNEHGNHLSKEPHRGR